MQNYGAGNLVFSASDLAVASECEWAQVRRIDKALGHDISVPENKDPMLVRAGELGDVHELKQLESYKSQFPGGVVEIERPDYLDKSRSIEQQMLELSAKTIEALRSKAPVVFQAAFYDGNFQGFADFLVLTPEGEYAVYDTKLARKAKITALIQLAAYAHQLELNKIPTSPVAHLMLGDKTITAHRLSDIMPTYLLRRRKMQALIAERQAHKDKGGSAVTWNEVGFEACGRCAVCEPQTEDNDDLLLVAGMRSEQRANLMAAGITTLRDLAEAAPASIPAFNPTSYQKICEQARMQLQTRMKPDSKIPSFELINATSLEALPEPNPGDIFFDFEGDPLYLEARIWNLDYLFGYADDSGKFKAIWAHNLVEEKKALIKFVKRLKKRIAHHPGMHIYHYGSYEKTHLLSMANRHGYAEDFIDNLLRHGTLVDLFPIVKKSLLIGVPSYSLKKLEPIFMSEKEREGVSSAVDSVVEYADYCSLILDNKAEEAAAKLADIEQYNKRDCEATLGLRNWLVSLAKENKIELRGSRGLEFPEDVAQPPDALVLSLMKLIEGTPPSERDSDQIAVALAAAAIDFHRREENSFWWAHYDRLASTLEDWGDTRDVYLVDSVEVERDWHIEGRQKVARRHLKVSASPGPGSRLVVNARMFLVYPESCSDLLVAPSPGNKIPLSCSILKVIDASTFLVQETVGGTGLEHSYIPEAVTPGAPPKTNKIEMAIRDWGEKVLKSHPKLLEDSALDILRRRSAFPDPLQTIASESPEKEIAKTLRGINSGTLAVQGPPGSGKSVSGGKVIAELVMSHGWRVGVVSQGHEAIENLLHSVAEAGLQSHLIGKGVRSDQSVEEVLKDESTTWTPLKKDGYAGFIRDRDAYVVGGTVWDFADPARVSTGALDLLVIDEAGQFSLANTIAASTASKRILLLGDPQQLAQVTLGTHPEPIDLSALGWLANGADVMPAEFGYFLPTSWRMNKAVCNVVSDNFYGSKLGSSARPRSLGGIDEGFYPIPINHSGNSSESVEEADRVVELVRDLLSRTWKEEGSSLSLADVNKNIIVVAPYNAQVQLIRSKLNAAGFHSIPVGTVDKFQGREAAVAIVSMTASSARDVPRGMDFLIMPNRLNVAISRSKWAAYFLYSPRLLDYKPTNEENLAFFSGFVNLVSN
ncbi:MAG: TM0106 family RecB-like putative nuclease [Aquiluna sp.]|nr:TM0106 family RecB-like putative nuclease [Aquiluna sp.]